MAAKLDQSIEKELLSRLKAGVYGTQYDGIVNERQEAFLGALEQLEDAEEDVDQDLEEDLDEEEDLEEEEENMHDFEFVEASEEEEDHSDVGAKDWVEDSDMEDQEDLEDFGENGSSSSGSANGEDSDQDREGSHGDSSIKSPSQSNPKRPSSAMGSRKLPPPPPKKRKL